MKGSPGTKCRVLPALVPAVAFGAAACGGDAALAQGELPAPYYPAQLVQPCDPDTPSLPALPRALCEADEFCWDNPLLVGRRVISLARVGAEVWATTSGGMVRHDGHGWSVLESPLIDPTQVVGKSDGSAFVLAGALSVARFDGADWQSRQLESKVYALGSAEGASVWALTDPELNGEVPSGGRLFRFDGTDWVFVAFGGVMVGEGLKVVSDTAIWAPSDEGFLQRFDGSDWTRYSFIDVVPPAKRTAAKYPAAFHAAGENDVWVSVETNDLVSRSYPGGKVVAERAGALLRFDGQAFNLVEGLPTRSLVTAIAGTGPDDVWFGTRNGEYLHWDGMRVTLDSVSARPSPAQAFARAPSDALLSLADGVVMERGRDGWSDPGPFFGPTPVLGANPGSKVWGSAWDDVWVVGAGGVRAHFDGKKWETSEPARDDVTGIWGSRREEVWTVSRNGDIDRFDGRRWRTVYESGLSFTDVWGLGNGELWMSVDDPLLIGVAHYEQGAFETFEEGAHGGRAIWASSGTDVWVSVSPAYQSWQLLHYDGETWATVAVEDGEAIADIWGRGPADVYATGVASSSLPLLLHYDGTDWKALTAPARPGTALWGCGDEDLFVADATGVTSVNTSDLRDGLPLPDGANLNATELTGVWAASADYIVAAGADGQILRRSR